MVATATKLRHAKRYRVPLLLGIGAVAVLGLTVATVCFRALRQREAVERLRALGGGIQYDFELSPGWRKSPWLERLARRLERDWLGPDFLHHVIGANLVYSTSGRFQERRETDGLYHQDLALLARLGELRHLLLHEGQACDQVLEHIRDLQQLETLYLWDAKVTDRGMENLQRLGRLRYLHLSNAGVSNAGLACLAELTRLEGLAMQGNRFTDDGLVHLRGLTKLRDLWLDGGATRISGVGLEYLAGLTDLEQLALQDTGFEDAGVEHLAPFRKLRILRLESTALTPDGLRRLQQIVPPRLQGHHRHPALIGSLAALPATPTNTSPRRRPRIKTPGGDRPAGARPPRARAPGLRRRAADPPWSPLAPASPVWSRVHVGGR
jgi:hypothetical protein